MNRLSSGTLTLGIIAILVGLVGAYGVRGMLYKPAEEPPKPRTVQIPVANAHLPTGRIIQRGDMTMSTQTVDSLLERGIALNQIIPDPQFALDRRVREPISAGEPILTSKLYLEGTGPTLADQLRPGERMVTVPVDASKGGLAPTGATVDVLFRTKPRAGNEFVSPIPEMTVTLVERVRVLDVKTQNAMMTGKSPTLVTLAVPADELHKIEVVEDHGTFSLVVRPADDFQRTASTDGPMTLEKVLNIQPPPPPPAPAPQPDIFRTVIFRGGSASVNSFINRQAATASLVADAESPEAVGPRAPLAYGPGAAVTTRGSTGAALTGSVGVPGASQSATFSPPEDCQTCKKDKGGLDPAPVADPYLAGGSSRTAAPVGASPTLSSSQRPAAPTLAPGGSTPVLTPTLAPTLNP